MVVSQSAARRNQMASSVSVDRFTEDGINYAVFYSEGLVARVEVVASDQNSLVFDFKDGKKPDWNSIKNAAQALKVRGDRGEWVLPGNVT